MSAFLLINFSVLGEEENAGTNNSFRKVVKK